MQHGGRIVSRQELARPVVEMRRAHRHRGETRGDSRAGPVVVKAAHHISFVRVAEYGILGVGVERLGVQRGEHGLRCSGQINSAPAGVFASLPLTFAAVHGSDAIRRR